MVAAPSTGPRGNQTPRKKVEDKDKTKPKGHTDSKASQPGSDGKGNKKKKQKGGFNIDALNPPFDPRMRRIGSPLNLTSRIKRGWIQDQAGEKKVNFLFNPPDLALTHSVDPNIPTPDQMEQVPDQAETNIDVPSVGSSTGVKLLYDRTYELFSSGKEGKTGFSNRFGVWADVAAWYYFCNMIPAYPDSWDDSMITSPPQYKPAYLFMGPRLVFYGWVNSLNVTYTHWTQDMVPARCAVDIGFTILPHSGDVPGRGVKTTDQVAQEITGWAQDWVGGLFGGGGDN